MIADEETRQAVQALIETTYEAMSTPGSDVADLFGSADIAIAGSGQGELWSGPEQVVAAATVVSSWGLRWYPRKRQSGDGETLPGRRCSGLYTLFAKPLMRSSHIGPRRSSALSTTAGIGSTGVDLNHRSRQRFDP